MTHISNINQITMSSPDLSKSERDAVAAVLRTPMLSMGSEVKEFEKAICEFTGSQYAVAVNSGTSGLHLCVRAVGIQPGDLVVTTPFSFVASTNAFLFEQAIPIFVDVDPVSGNIDPGLVKMAVEDLNTGRIAAQKWLPRKIPKNIGQPKVILPVDVFGQPADFDPINEVAQRLGLKVIEDSCEAIGATYKSRQAGLLGDYGVFAFYPNKQMTTGEGGIIVTNDKEAADMMRSLRNQGRSPGDTWLQHTYLGYNYRLDEMSAALGKIQVGRLDELLEKREVVAGWYEERIKEIPGVDALEISQNTSRMSWFVYVVRFSREVNRDAVAELLEKKGIPNRPYFLPIHLQPYMVERFGYQEGDFQITEDLGRRSLALPFSGVMQEEQVDHVCKTLRDVLNLLM